MGDDKWQQVEKSDRLKEGVPVMKTAGGEEVLLVRLGGQVYAMAHECTHYGAPLSQGHVSGTEVTCPWHNAKFDLTSGKMVGAPALDDLTTYPVKEEDGAVYLGPAEQPEPRGVRDDDGTTIAIVGGGAAGNACAEMLRREGYAGRVILVTAEKGVPYDRPNLSKEYMAGEAEPDWIPLRDEDFYRKQRIELWNGRRVTAVDSKGKQLTFDDGETLAFDQLLLATGGRPRKLDAPGTDLDGFFLLRSLADAEAIVAAAEKAKAAVVLGASFIGLEVASSLRHRKLEVHVAAPEEVPMERVFGKEVGQRLRRLHEKEDVHFHLGTTAKQIVGNGKVEAVELEDGTRIEADLVVAGLGIEPVVDYLEGTGLVEDGAVPVDGRLQTTAEGIFAAGDIARVPDPRSGESHRIEHWVVAERHGQHVARAMLGSQATYDQVPFFWTNQHSAKLKYAGFPSKWDRIAYRGDVEEGNFVAGYYADGTLRAVLTNGKTAEFLALQKVIHAGVDLPPETFEDEDVDMQGFLPC